jgi:hypothetical protein
MVTPKPHDVALLCNPLAGGRWRALADVLDSEDAKGVRRIVTDEIDDVAEALAGVGQRARLLCIYGGDGTIYHVINQILQRPSERLPRLAFLGGGTMNVTGRVCGMVGSPGDNFRAVMRAYKTDQLHWRDVPVLKIQHSGGSFYGFTFGLGPLVRILDRYERGQKGKLAAAAIGARAIAAAISPLRGAMGGILEDMEAMVNSDGNPLPYGRYSAVFANTTGSIQRLVEPFSHTRTPDSFHFLAYAISVRELAMHVPSLMRGKLPVDKRALLDPQTMVRFLRGAGNGKPDVPTDPRYINHAAQRIHIQTSESVFTLDGEVLQIPPDGDGSIDVTLGPSLQLAVTDGIG